MKKKRANVKGCSKRFCVCFKFGDGCNSSSGCGVTCQNKFNHLDYFFDKDEKCSANPWFSNYLVKNADELRRDIMRCHLVIQVYFLNEEFNEWAEKWDAVNEDEDLDYIQKLFRILLSNDTTTLFYSFCNEDVFEDNCQWHCIKGQKYCDCKKWHCEEGDECIYSSE